MNRYAQLLLYIAILSLGPSSSAAQPVNLQIGGIEGHVFNLRTMKPLSGATITVVVSSPTGESSSLPQYFDNPSGFYNVLFTTINMGLPATSSTVTAYCKLSNGRVISSAVPLYTTPQPIVYRRDIYIELPRSYSRCLPLDGATPGQG